MTNWDVLAPLAVDGNLWIFVLLYEHKWRCVIKCRTGIALSHLPPNWHVYNLAVTLSLLTHFFSLKFCFVSYWCSYSWILFFFSWYLLGISFSIILFSTFLCLYILGRPLAKSMDLVYCFTFNPVSNGDFSPFTVMSRFFPCNRILYSTTFLLFIFFLISCHLLV